MTLGCLLKLGCSIGETLLRLFFLVDSELCLDIVKSDYAESEKKATCFDVIYGAALFLLLIFYLISSFDSV